MRTVHIRRQKGLIEKRREQILEVTVGKSGLRRLYSWRPSARFGCLGVFVFCGIFTFCPIAYIFVGQMWEPPSLETRMKVSADLRSCMLKESEIPEKWDKDLTYDMPLKGPDSPIPIGMLGGIFAAFSHQSPNTGWTAAHELHLYERLDQAVYIYAIGQLSINSEWNRTWESLDLSQANLSANQYRAACSDFELDGGSGRRGRCEAKIRYGKFLSMIYADVSPTDISIEEFIQALQAIDRNMLQCIDAFADKK